MQGNYSEYEDINQYLASVHIDTGWNSPIEIISFPLLFSSSEVNF